MGRISPGPTRWPPGAERRLVPAKSNLKPQTSNLTWDVGIHVYIGLALLRTLTWCLRTVYEQKKRVGKREEKEKKEKRTMHTDGNIRVAEAVDWNIRGRSGRELVRPGLQKEEEATEAKERQG